MNIIKIVNDPIDNIGALTQVGSKKLIEHFIHNIKKSFNSKDIIIHCISSDSSFYSELSSICSAHSINIELSVPEYSLKSLYAIYEKYKIKNACVIRDKFYFQDNETIKNLEKNISKDHDITTYSPFPQNNSYRSSGPVISLNGLKKAIEKQVLSIEQIIWEPIMNCKIVEFFKNDISYLKYDAINYTNIKKIACIVEYLEKNNIAADHKNIVLHQKQSGSDISMPKEIKIELTNECNLQCSFCPHNKLTRKKGYMSSETFNRIVSELKDTHQKFEVELSGFGEPLMHPEFFDLIDQNTFPLTWKTYLYTNGTLLKKMKKLVEIEFDCIFFSIDAYFPKTYEQLKKQDFLRPVLKNIEKLSSLKQKNNKILSFVSRYMKKNQLALTMIKTIETKREYSSFFVDWGYYIQAQSDFKYHEKKEKFIEMRKNYNRIQNKTAEDHFRFYQQKQLFNWSFPIYFRKNSPILVEHTLINHFNDFCKEIDDISYGKYIHLEKNNCVKADNSLTILWNGDVVRCFQDFDGKHVLGNIHERTIEQIWNENPYRNLNTNIFEKDLCKNCSDHYYL